LKRLQVSELSRADGTLGLHRLDAFSGLDAFFTTIPAIKRVEGLRPFCENPKSQIADNRINEDYVEVLCAAFSLPYTELETGAQVHGTKVVVARNTGRRHNAETDGIIVTKPGGGAAVFTADCQAVVLWDAETRASAVVHAGWRGAVAGISTAAVDVMEGKFHCRPDSITAFLGPAISSDNYPVGPEVGEAAATAFPGGGVMYERNGTIYLDVTECNRINLLKAGISDEYIFTVDACTYRDAELFYSYRREGAAAGRLMTAVYVPKI
jgi:YfiH family protein